MIACGAPAPRDCSAPSASDHTYQQAAGLLADESRQAGGPIAAVTDLEHLISA